MSDFSIFAGVLKNINNNLCIDCNNQGVSFSITKENCTVDQILNELPTIETEKLVNKINPKKLIRNQNPIMNIKLTYFTCGGMVIGICWHHSIGDMHTFMELMKAWSNSVNKKEYILPLIVEERDRYLQESLKTNNNNIPGVRYLDVTELFRLIFYMLVQARNKLSLQFYFSENELNNMKQSFSEKTNKLLSINDVLCAQFI